MMPTPKVNGRSELVSLRFRKDVLARVREKSEELRVPLTILLQGYAAWVVSEHDAGRGPTASDLLTLLWPTRGRPRKMGGEGQVYFIQASDSGYIKIGWSTDVAARVESLQMGFPEKLQLLLAFKGTRAMEKQLHEKFVSYRVRGEWFRPEPLLLKGIEMLRERAEAKGIK